MVSLLIDILRLIVRKKVILTTIRKKENQDNIDSH